MNRIHRPVLLALCLLAISLAAVPPAHGLSFIGFTVSASGLGDTRSEAIDAAVAELYAKNFVFGDRKEGDYRRQLETEKKDREKSKNH